MKQIQEEIKKLNDLQMIRKLLRGARIGLWVIELEKNKQPRMYADETMNMLLGIEEALSPEDTYAWWYSRVNDADRSTVQETVNKIADMKFAEVSYNYHHPDAGEMYVRCGGVRNAHEHSFISMSGYHQNITEVMQLTREKEILKVNNDELLDSLHNIFASLYRLDLENGKVMTMRLPDDLTIAGENDYDVFMEQSSSVIYEDDVDEFLNDFSLEHLRKLREKGWTQFVREYRRKIGKEYRWMTYQVYFCQLADGHSWGILGTYDVHERKSLDEEKTRALRDACDAAQMSAAAKTDFLSRMSHDLRTPINAILGMTTLARKKRSDSEQLLYYLDKIEEAGRLLSDQMNTLLVYSRIDSGNQKLMMERIDLVSLIHSCADDVSQHIREKHLNLAIHTAEMTHTQVYGDGEKLRIIIMNFLTNAIRFTEDGGHIYLAIRELHPDRDKNDAYIGYRIECEDDGEGIDEQFLPKIFEPFSQEKDSRKTRVEGSGLGLAITRNLVTLMNGQIDVRSKKGEGSCFTAVIYLQSAEEAEEEVIEEDVLKEEEENLLSGISVLLVEDNELNREIAEELLLLAGARVTCAINGQEAVDAYAADENAFDIILMDIKMPVMDGNEAARRIRAMEAGRKIPIIALTANHFAEDVAESLKAGIDRHLGKPYIPDDLYDIIRELVK